MTSSTSAIIGHIPNPPATGIAAMEEIIIESEGATLLGTLYRPNAPVARAIVLHSATGVPQAYYDKFARWLCETEAAAVLTYDYRDFGASASGPISLSRASMVDWAVRDQSAALDKLIEIFPASSVWVVGHSLGGMYVPFHRQAHRIERLIAVASGPAYWLRHPVSYLPRVVLFWWLLGPAATAWRGYLPGKALGLGADLPADVYWQWRRWCLSKAFNRGDWGGLLPRPDLNAMTGRLTLIALSDDVMIPPASGARSCSVVSTSEVRLSRPSSGSGWHWRDRPPETVQRPLPCALAGDHGPCVIIQ